MIYHSNFTTYTVNSLSSEKWNSEMKPELEYYKRNEDISKPTCLPPRHQPTYALVGVLLDEPGLADFPLCFLPPLVSELCITFC